MEVFLNVYDVGPIAAYFNAVARNLPRFLGGGSGAYHAAVEIAGQEISYGKDDHDTGIFICEPMACEDHVFRERISLGITPLSLAQVQFIIRRAQADPKYHGKNYDLVNFNCVRFCQSFAEELQVSSLPTWTFDLCYKAEGLVGAGSMLLTVSKASSTSQSLHQSAGSMASSSSQSLRQSAGSMASSTSQSRRQSPSPCTKVKKTVVKRKAWRCSGCAKVIVQYSKALHHAAKCAPGCYITEVADPECRPQPHILTRQERMPTYFVRGFDPRRR
jgi:hypothetical protein